MMLHEDDEEDTCLGCGETFPLWTLNERFYCEYCQDPRQEEGDESLDA